MKVFIISFITIITLVGCAGKEANLYATQCPKFTKKIDVNVIYLNDEYAKLSWEDIKKLQELGAAIRLFNKRIEELNR